MLIEYQFLETFDTNGNFTHYTSTGECGVSKSPCTNFSVKVTKKIFYGYKIFSTEN